MVIVKPSVEIVNPQSYETVLDTVEHAIRNCYQSFDKIKEGSAEGIIRGCINRGHCYDGETEILTSEGFIPFYMYAGQDVAVVNTDGTFKGFEKPLRIIHQSYSGTLYDYSKTLGIKVTNHHKMFGTIYRTTEDAHNFNYKLFDVGEISYAKNSFYALTNGQRKFWTPQSCRCDDSLLPYWELVGFWIGDGERNSSTANKLRFHLRKIRKIEYLKSLCIRLGYVFEEMGNDRYNVCCDGIAKIFNNTFVKDGEKYLNMNIVLPQQIKSIIYGLIQADGSVNIKYGHVSISTTSSYIKDWLLCRGILADYPLYFDRVGNSTLINHKPCYRIRLSTAYRYVINDARKQSSFVDIYEASNVDVYCVTTSTGIIIVRGKHKKIPFLCGNCSPIEFGDICVKITTDRSVSHQLVRHRLCNFAQQSQRYVNYSKEKFGENIKVIVPQGITDETYETWRASVLASEAAYMVMTKDHNVPAEVARSVLPNCCATTIYMKANIREWRHIFSLRCDFHSQKDIRLLMTDALHKMYELYPVFFEDLVEKFPKG